MVCGYRGYRSLASLGCGPGPLCGRRGTRSPRVGERRPQGLQGAGGGLRCPVAVDQNGVVVLVEMVPLREADARHPTRTRPGAAGTSVRDLGRIAFVRPSRSSTSKSIETRNQSVTYGIVGHEGEPSDQVDILLLDLR
jgi:hypothetical protein